MGMRTADMLLTLEGGNMRRRVASAFLAIALLSGAQIPDSRAAWAPDGVALSPAATNYKPVIVSDGLTGSIVAWYGGAGSDILVRRILQDGSNALGWPTTLPLVVCGATGLQEQPAL